MVGSPAGPTVAPRGRFAAVASVAAVGVVVAAGGVELVGVAVPEEPPLAAGSAGALGVGVDAAVAAPPDPALSSSPSNLTWVRRASELSWTRSEEVPESDGTALPSTTRRP